MGPSEYKQQLSISLYVLSLFFSRRCRGLYKQQLSLFLFMPLMTPLLVVLHKLGNVSYLVPAGHSSVTTTAPTPLLIPLPADGNRKLYSLATFCTVSSWLVAMILSCVNQGIASLSIAHASVRLVDLSSCV